MNRPLAVRDRQLADADIFDERWLRCLGPPIGDRAQSCDLDSRPAIVDPAEVSSNLPGRGRIDRSVLHADVEHQRQRAFARYLELTAHLFGSLPDAGRVPHLNRLKLRGPAERPEIPAPWLEHRVPPRI